MSYDSYLEPPDDIECCESDDCTTVDADGFGECRCEEHYCETCDTQCGCRCDADYERWKESQLDY